MTIQRDAHVARTAHDKTHGNKLAVPSFGVIELRLRAGAKGSKSHLPAAAATVRAPGGQGSDDFAFAPGPQLDPGTWAVDPARKDEVELWYDLHNPQGAIREAHLELFRRFDAKPFWTRELTGDELLEGEHVLEFGTEKKWNGKIDPAHADFPGDFLTVEHSPYKLRLTVKGDGVTRSPVAWTFFHVLVAKLELEYGPKTILPAAVARKGDPGKLYDAVIAKGAAPPASGAAIDVLLESNLFKAGHSMFDDSLHDEYHAMWDDGPLIPLFAKVWVQDSAGQPVLAPKALGQVKFLWDWESAAAGTGNAFVDAAQDYDKAKTKPKGENCHVKRNGKRGPSGVPVFPAQAGYAPKAPLDANVFPFKVEACPKPRTWAAYSYAWDDGAAACKTGVMLQPSRMAGDAVKLAVHVAHDVTRKKTVVLNIADDAPLPVQALLKAQTGSFRIWREVHLVKYVKKTAAVPDLTIANVQAIYKPAFLQLEDKSGGSSAMASGTWNTAFTGAVGGLSAAQQDMVDGTVDQHAAGAHGCEFRTLAAWQQAVATRLGITLVAAQNALAANGISNAAQYAALCNNVGSTILESVFNGQLSATEGAHIFHVDGLHNHTAAAASVLRGYALDLPGGDDRHCGYLQLGKTTDYAGAPNDVREMTGAHEFGHHFMLPHTPAAGEKKDYKMHDKAVTNCLMSYNFTTPRTLCGFCQLRLRGWPWKQLRVDAAKNRK